MKEPGGCGVRSDGRYADRVVTMDAKMEVW